MVEALEVVDLVVTVTVEIEVVVAIVEETTGDVVELELDPSRDTVIAGTELGVIAAVAREGVGRHVVTWRPAVNELRASGWS